MGKKKKKTGQVLGPLRVENTAAEGLGVSRLDSKVVFVEKAVPGDVVMARITQDKSSWLRADIATLLEPSPKRVQAFCSHFSVCGGCRWQQMEYAAQLDYKNRQVHDAFERIAKVAVAEWLPILPSEETRYYRNKLEFTFTNKGYLEVFDKNNPDHLNVQALGYHVPGRFDKVFDVETCHLMPALANDIRNGLRNFCLNQGHTFFDLNAKTGLMRNLLMRCNSRGQWMVMVVFGENNETGMQGVMNWLQDSFPQITSLHRVVNTKLNDSLDGLSPECVHGDPWLTENLGGLSFRIQPKSFFQTNTRQAEKLYEITKNFACLDGSQTLYDLYSGTGTIGLYVADQCHRVTGIEYVQDAVADAFENAKLNGITNAAFYAGDMAKVLSADFVKEQGKPDVVITDPPRAGMHPDVVANLLHMLPERIVYVSCNPATQARDVQLLSGSYKVHTVQPVDMFPHTHHVESVALLTRNH